jgi:leucyl aminopeptidase
MEIKLIDRLDLSSKRDLLILPLTEGPLLDNPLAAAMDSALEGALSRAAGQEDFQGKIGQALALNTLGRLPVERIVLLGLGETTRLSSERRRRVAGRSVDHMRKVRAVSACLICQASTGGNFDPAGEAAAMAGGIELALYRFGKYKRDNGDKPPYEGPATLDLLVCGADGIQAPDSIEIREAVDRAILVAGAVRSARDLINEIPQEMTPDCLARSAMELSGGIPGLSCRVLDEKEMEKEGMGAALAVGRGSDSSPRFIELAWSPDCRTDSSRHLVLVGKGVTFDSGGLNLKPGESMLSMKADMSGAAAVVCAITVIARLKLPLRVTALVAAVENMPSGRSYRPDDIVRAFDGTTIEIGNTDAEGRLTLADALGWAVARCGATCIVDLATLTGACMVGLGVQTAGVFGCPESWRDRVLTAAHLTGEKCAVLPLDEDLADDIKSENADVRNTGSTRYGGAITAALFLQRFVKDIPWTHLDIAGPAWTDKRRDYAGPGGTGFGVRTLVRLAEELSHETE